MRGSFFVTATALLVILASAAAARAQPPLRTTVYASGFTAPVAFVQSPTDRAVQFVVEQFGRIRTVRSGVVLPTDFLNLSSAIVSGGEQGLLGLAFAPDYATSGRFYVNFTNTAGNTVVARFKRSADPLIADPASRFDLRWGGAGGAAFIVQPFTNHNGGNLIFGPDGFLYIGLGDGGSGDDPGHLAQNPAELLGKMLRVDVNVPDSDPIGYRVPPSNPFVSGGPAGTRPEIWSFGLRNPWRYSFDDPARGGTGALVIGDVGQGSWEEVDYEPAARGGRNYGWRNREGAHDHIAVPPPAFTPLIDPIHEYDHNTGGSITGGYVYRGHGLGPAFRGRYFFADFVKGRVWSMGLAIDPSSHEAQKADLVEHTAALGGAAPLGNVSSFGVDASGELYLVIYAGRILKVLGTPGSGGDFDDDGKGDLAVYRPSSGNWFIRNSTSGFTTSTVRQWGLGGDVPVPGDYDGDGSIDLAVWRPANATWYILQSSTGFTTSLTRQWGFASDVPVPGDYDGDGRIDLAVYRPSNGVWFVLTSSSNYTTQTTVTLGSGTDIPVPADYDADGISDVAVYRPATGVWTIRTSRDGFASSLTLQWGLRRDVPVPGDYDGDGFADVAVYRPATGEWFIRFSATGFTTSASFQWGLSSDVAVPSDYDGDGKIDLAVYRPSTGTWFIRQSTTNYATSVSFQWGLGGDLPTPNAAIAYAMAAAASRSAGGALANLVRASDFDGDGQSDLTVFRPSTGTWFNLKSASGYTTSAANPWGLNRDMPVPGDYDGDGQTDLAVYRTSTGRFGGAEATWFVLLSSSNFTTSWSLQWGATCNGFLGGATRCLDDIPVPGDYDGDGRADLAVFNPLTGVWRILQSSTEFTTSTSFQWGLSQNPAGPAVAPDIPVPGDYDGDGVTDLAVYRPSTGEWFIRQSTTGYSTSVTFQWGLGTDITVPGDYDGDGKTDLAVYRPSTSVWFIRQSSTNFASFVTFQWGLNGDVPVPGEYDGDAKTDLAVYRPSSRVWFLLKSSTNFTTSAAIGWGESGDIPILGRQ